MILTFGPLKLLVECAKKYNNGWIILSNNNLVYIISSCVEPYHSLCEIHDDQIYLFVSVHDCQPQKFVYAIGRKLNQLGLTVGFLLLWYSVVYTVGSLSLFYLIFISRFVFTRR